MSLPSELTEALSELLEKDVSFKVIDSNAKNISKKYRENNNSGERLVTTNNEAISYALSRMPATYEAVQDCLDKIFQNNQFDIRTTIDVGAGTGAATWALHDYCEPQKSTCLEREDEMIKIGKKLMSNSSISSDVTWEKYDVLKDKIDGTYDFVVVSYMINELPKNEIKNVLEKLWNATGKVLLILEPGTPNGFSNIKRVREVLLSNGANVISPCTHEKECPLPENDWCQFSCRVQRSKVHKKLKDGSSPFEDEKYSYIAFSRNDCEREKYRILRHPIINKGYTEFKICSKDAKIESIKLSKKDGSAYKESKKKSAGDSLDL